jgi:hypothetical protein
MLAILTSTTLMAQRDHQGNLPSLTEGIKGQLALTAEQATALEALQQTTKSDLQALHESSELDHEARRAAAREIFDRANTSRNEILNGEQQAQLKAIRAQQHQEHRERMAKVDHKAMRSEMREYRKTEIQPVVKAQRAKLDSDLSTEDQQRLDEIRAMLKTARQAAKAEHKEQRAQPEGKQADRQRSQQAGHHGNRGHHRQGGKIHRLAEKHPDEFAELSAMVAKYDDEITTLLAELEPKQQEWRDAQRAIAERYLPEGKPQRGEHHRSHANQEGEHAERKAQMHKINFLLKSAKEETAEREATTASVERIAARTYPNPATNATTLTFDLPNSLELAIDIRDENGKLVKKITQEQFAKGKHEVNVDVSDLRNGTYYLTLSGNQLPSPQTVKVVIVK